MIGGLSSAGFWLRVAATLGRCLQRQLGSASPNAVLDIANTQCLIGTWTLDALCPVTDRPMGSRRGEKQGTATVKFEADEDRTRSGTNGRRRQLYGTPAASWIQTIDATREFHLGQPTATEPVLSNRHADA